MLPLLLTVMAAFGLALAPIWDSDVWWQLACGRAIATTHGLPSHDLFSFTAPDRPWDTAEWLAQLLLYVGWWVGGLGFLTVCKAAVAGWLATVLFRDAARGAARPTQTWLVAAACVLSAYLMRWNLVERPQVFAMLLLALELALLRSGARRWPCLVIALAWANLHGGSALLAPCVLALWLAAEALATRPGRRDAADLRVLAGTLALLACNPAGLRLYAYPFVAVRDTLYMTTMAEWLPPTAADDVEFFWWLAAAAGAGIVGARAWKPPDLAVGAATLGLALISRRHIPLALIALTPPLARHLAARLPRRAGRPVAGAAGLAAAAALGLAGYRGEALRLGVNASLYPVEAMDAVRALPVGLRRPASVRLFAMNEWGGYLTWHAWPALRVFIDGRGIVYGPALFDRYRRIVTDHPDAPALLRLDAPDCFLLDRNAPLNRRLAASADYALVHWDDTCQVYVRVAAFHPAWLATHAYRAARPEPVPGAPAAAILAELTRAAWEAPRDARPWTIRARFFLASADLPSAWTAAQTSLTRRPDGVEGLLGAFAVAMARGDTHAAETLARRALRADPDGVAPTLALARLAEARGDTSEARRLIERALARADERERRTGRVDPGLAAARQALGR